MKICLVEDDLELGRALEASLRASGFETLWVRRAREARAFIADEAVEAVLLDIGLPDASGFDVLRELRRAKPTLPTLVITAREALADRLAGLDLGADDYLVKPFAVAELLARLRAVLRRAHGGHSAGMWEVRGLALDELRFVATREGTVLALSPSEFALLRELMRHGGRVLTRRELEARALEGSEGQSLDSHMSNLRKKIGNGYIRTVRGVGYAIDP